MVSVRTFTVRSAQNFAAFTEDVAENLTDQASLHSA